MSSLFSERDVTKDFLYKIFIIDGTLQKQWVIATHFLGSKYSDNPLPELE